MIHKYYDILRKVLEHLWVLASLGSLESIPREYQGKSMCCFYQTGDMIRQARSGPEIYQVRTQWQVMKQQDSK